MQSLCMLKQVVYIVTTGIKGLWGPLVWATWWEQCGLCKFQAGVFTWRFLKQTKWPPRASREIMVYTLGDVTKPVWTSFAGALQNLRTWPKVRTVFKMRLQANGGPWCALGGTGGRGAVERCSYPSQTVRSAFWTLMFTEFLTKIMHERTLNEMKDW
jgi:hypothetical protein